MHEDIVGRRRAERERCNDAARRSKGPLLVGYINAANYYGAPIPRHCTLSVDAVHACVSSANKRRRIKGVVFHVFKGKLDIRKKDYEQFWIASPVMMWAQMAQYSTLEELAAIGASLMSRDKRRRMATRKDFDTYLEISPRFIGRNKCHEALPYMTENTGYRPKCVSVLACVPLWQWAFLLFELYGRGTRGRPECVSGMAGQALRHNG